MKHHTQVRFLIILSVLACGKVFGGFMNSTPLEYYNDSNQEVRVVISGYVYDYTQEFGDFGGELDYIVSPLSSLNIWDVLYGTDPTTCNPWFEMYSSWSFWLSSEEEIEPLDFEFTYVDLFDSNNDNTLDTIRLPGFTVEEDAWVDHSWDVDLAELANQLDEAMRDYSSFTIADLLGGSVSLEITAGQMSDAEALIKNTMPAFWNNYISQYKIVLVSNLPSTRGGASNFVMENGVWKGYIYINSKTNGAYSYFTGNRASYLAAVILHEAHHLYYRRSGGEAFQTGASDLQDEASTRYSVEQWAVENNIPQVNPNGRVNGQANYNNIINNLDTQVYSATTIGGLPTWP